MALINFSLCETEPDSAYDKGPLRYFDTYKLTNKGGASFNIFSIRYIYFLEKLPHWIRQKIFLEHNLLMNNTPKGGLTLIWNFFHDFFHVQKLKR